MLRPGLIQADGVRFKTLSCRLLYGLARPLFPAVSYATELGKVMLILVEDSAPERVLRVQTFSPFCRQSARPTASTNQAISVASLCKTSTNFNFSY